MKRIATVFALCGPLVGQVNLVTNGDFQSGNTNGWTLRGHAQLPGVMSFDTTGIGASLGFSLRPGCRANQAPPCVYSMEQDVLLVKGAKYLLTADIAMINTEVLHAVDGGRIQFHADGVMLKKVQFGNPYAKIIRRQRVCIRFSPVSSGSRPLRISFDRNWGARALTPRHHIDNIRLVIAPRQPILCPRGERKVGANTSLRLDSYGTPSARFGAFVAFGARPPIVVPGLVGTWSLGSPNLLVFAGLFDSGGAHSISIPLAVAASLAGVPLHWQGVEVTGRTGSIGEPAQFGVYK